jgi:hypothetical protein
MGSTWVYSFAGAGVGFLVGFAVLWMMTSAQPPSDRYPVALFVGIFLAGSGAIAGAIIGGVADLLKFVRRRERARTESQTRCKSKSEV